MPVVGATASGPLGLAEGTNEGIALLLGLGPKLGCGADGVTVGDNSEGEKLMLGDEIAPVGEIMLEGAILLPPTEDEEAVGSTSGLSEKAGVKLCEKAGVSETPGDTVGDPSADTVADTVAAIDAVGV